MTAEILGLFQEYEGPLIVKVRNPDLPDNPRPGESKQMWKLLDIYIEAGWFLRYESVDARPVWYKLDREAYRTMRVGDVTPYENVSEEQVEERIATAKKTDKPIYVVACYVFDPKNLAHQVLIAQADKVYYK